MSDWQGVSDAVNDLLDFIEDADTTRPGYAMDLAEKSRVAREVVKFPCDGLDRDGKSENARCCDCNSDATYCGDCAKTEFGPKELKASTPIDVSKLASEASKR